MTGARWGKAGQRLTESEARTRTNKARAAREARARTLADHERVARARWSRGLVVPALITRALDAGGHEGPEVDAACGVQEPTVDLWEAGDVYPTWEQLCALAQLTGVLPAYFTGPWDDAHHTGWTSLAFHIRGWRAPPPPILSFTPAAVDACMNGPVAPTLF